MDSISYLLELLETQNSVGINGLGTLYKKKIPGRYDAKTHAFLPPKYEISFTNDVKEGQELVNFLSNKKSISIESATSYVAEFVEKINSQLADQQRADFSPFGELKFINNQIVFESSGTKEIDFDFYGLPSIEDNSSKPNEPSEIIDEKSETPEYSPFNDPLWKPAPINRLEYDDDEESEGRGKRLFLKIALLFLIIAAGAITTIYFVFPDLYTSVKESFFGSQTAIQSAAPTVVLDTNIKKIDSNAVDSLKKPTLSADTPKSKSLTTTTVPNTIHYEVIGSAMKTQKKVDEVIAKLSKSGINAKKMEALPGRLIKISLGTFTDFNLAKKFQDSLKIKLKNPDIYIQTIKPKN